MRRFLFPVSALVLAAVFAASVSAGGRDGLIVHEWGTFTSFAGSDGRPIAFATEPRKDLPGFVYTHDQLRGRRGKSIASLQRMETPVTYFYTDRPTDVDVEIGFPEGALTEFYPHARDVSGSAGDERSPPSGGRLRFGKVRVIPEDHPEASGVALPQLAKDESAALAEHYFFARETDSALVRVCRTDGLPAFPTEHEKFLFYRGVGSFAMPLVVTAHGGGRVWLRTEPVPGVIATDPFSSVAYPLGPVFVLEVDDDRSRARLMETRAAAPGARAAYGVDFGIDLGAERRPLAEVASDLADRMTAALVEAGLYEKEAAAMVKTWRSSWFEEPGLRVLYLLPQEFADVVLPLRVTPAPTETVRVLVGRAEVLTPEREADYARRGVPESEGRFAGAIRARLATLRAQ